ncbi:MAG TPA: YraN family protein [Thermoanaerobaculia bacterium]|nr:YraN family protein [Thermoanaerobaculia bacterium]
MSILSALFRSICGPWRIPVAKLGRMGERRAAWYYRLRGYSILERNLRLSAGEIDLVVKRGATVVIAEVKTRQSDVAGEGHEAVNRKKRERMIKLGDQYAAKHPEAQLRYDILSLRWTGRRFIVSHYEDAFRPVADAQRPWIWRA